MSKRIDELKAEIMSLSSLLDVNNKQKRDYTRLLSDSPNIERGHGQKKPSQGRKKPFQRRNKKRKERGRINRTDRLRAQTDANKVQIKNL